jgi:hypothetical protein
LITLSVASGNKSVFSWVMLGMNAHLQKRRPGGSPLRWLSVLRQPPGRPSRQYLGSGVVRAAAARAFLVVPSRQY